MLEELVAMFLDRLFPGFTVEGSGLFRLIRDTDVEFEEEAEDLVRSYETALKRRRRGVAIHLTIQADMPEDLRELVVDAIEAPAEEVYSETGLLGLVDVKQLIVDDRPDLLFPPYTPRFPERIRDFGGDCFAAIRAKDIIVHHPFESFDVVVQFLRQAAHDPAVVAVKQTLYRTSRDSPIVKALIEAAEAGKSVTAMVELRARFDEEANIRLARTMEAAGVQVVFGFAGLKTHAKLSAGRPPRGEQPALLCAFRHRQLPPDHRAHLHRPLVLHLRPGADARCGAAVQLHDRLCPPGGDGAAGFQPADHAQDDRHADRQRDRHRQGRQAVRHLAEDELAGRRAADRPALRGLARRREDHGIVVRGICCLRPGVPGLSENIRVKSIVGRFLEHSRICVFGNGHALPSRENKVFMSSADWMARNMDWRVETLVPIHNPTVHAQVLDQIMVVNLRDDAQSSVLRADGTWHRVASGDPPASAHEYFMTNPSLSGRGSALHGGLAADRPKPKYKRRVD